MLPRTRLSSAFSTILATTLGTIAALGLSRLNKQGDHGHPDLADDRADHHHSDRAVLLLFVDLDLEMEIFGWQIPISGSFWRMRRCIPFVIITVTATLVGFDHSLTCAAASLGAGPVTFRQIQMPLILPVVIPVRCLLHITRRSCRRAVCRRP